MFSSGGGGRKDCGTENDNDMCLVSSPVSIVVVLRREDDTQRYITGAGGVCDSCPFSSSGSRNSSAPAGALVGVRSSAVASAFLLFLGRDCFLRSRLIVSAYGKFEMRFGL